MKRVVGVVLLLIGCARPCSHFVWDDDPIFYLTGKVVNSYYQPETWNEHRAWYYKVQQSDGSVTPACFDSDARVSEQKFVRFAYQDHCHRCMHLVEATQLN